MVFGRKVGSGRSRTKIGTFLAGLGVILATVGAYFLGEIELVKAIPVIVTAIGTILALFGIRDLPVLNMRTNERDRIVYDPSVLNSNDVEEPNRPIRVRRHRWGTNIAEAGAITTVGEALKKEGGGK